MISMVGDEDYDNIKFPNGMVVKIDFGTEPKDIWGFRGRISGSWRRIRLFDENDNQISEVIERNPLYQPPKPFDDEFFEGMDPKIM